MKYGLAEESMKVYGQWTTLNNAMFQDNFLFAPFVLSFNLSGRLTLYY